MIKLFLPKEHMLAAKMPMGFTWSFRTIETPPHYTIV
jgi:hypothetical protein